jgi:hypothetical protein
MCNPVNYQTYKEQKSTLADELDGSDVVRATAPDQPDIYIPAALQAFKTSLDDALDLKIIVTEITGDANANYQISYYWTGVSYMTGYLAGFTPDGRSYVNVNASEASVKVLTDTVHMYYGGAGTGVGNFFFNAVKFLMNHNGKSNPSDLEVLCYMDAFKVRSIYEYTTGEKWIRLQMIPDGGAPYLNIYMKPGSAAYLFAEGWYNNFSDMP